MLVRTGTAGKLNTSVVEAKSSESAAYLFGDWENYFFASGLRRRR